MSKFVYSVLYRTVGFENRPFHREVEDWSIELFHEGREFRLMDQLLIARDIHQLGVNPRTYNPPVRTLRTGDEVPHFLISVFLNDLNPLLAKYASDRADEVINILSLIYNQSLFGELIFRNFLSSDKKKGFVGVAPEYRPIRIDHANAPTRVAKILAKTHESEDCAALSRLISHIRTRTSPPPTIEQQFFDLWLVLDIYPMGTKTNSRDKRLLLAQKLAEITGRTASEVEAKLHLNHLQVVRGHLAHRGTFEPRFSETKYDDVHLLNVIVDVCLREFYGFGYQGQLRHWLDKHPLFSYQ